VTAPIPQPSVHPNVQPYYVRQTQDWTVQQERQRHTQALYQIGEPALFVLMWKVEDFEAGYTSRCPRCRANDGSVDSRIEAVYRQTLTATCPWCFGTTFTGGVRAKIIRPAIFTDVDEDERKSARGVVHPESCQVETTEDFRSRTGDYVFRQDGSRWQLGAPTRIQLRTGYQHPSQGANSIGYGRITASREDEASVAFQIPPNRQELQGWLAAPAQWPGSSNDLVSGPLIPGTEVQ
jgi:hypothetical protein